jgi:ribonucleotide reductase alpha subunit
MRIEFESKEAEFVNEKIFETIYYGAVLASIKIAAKDGYY